MTGSLRRWAAEAEDCLRDADPSLPDSLGDRAQDACEVLAAIADLAGGEWPRRARRAFVAVMGEEAEDTDPGVLLIAHIRDAFDKPEPDGSTRTKTRSDGSVWISTIDLLYALVSRGDDSPWAGWWARSLDEGHTRAPAMRLAQMLRGHDIRPKDIRDGLRNAKGYDRADFLDAWDRYVPTP